MAAVQSTFVQFAGDDGDESKFEIQKAPQLRVGGKWTCTKNVMAHMGGDDHADRGETRSAWNESWTICWILEFPGKTVEIRAKRRIHRNEDCKWVWYGLLQILKTQNVDAWFESDERYVIVEIDGTYSTERCVQDGFLIAL